MENLIKFYYKIRTIFTPVKMISIIAIILGLVDNLSNPIRHILRDGQFELFEINPTTEWILRLAFIFCGFFGLFGNGKTKVMRSTIISLPFLYLGIYYLFLFIEYGNPTLYIPMFTTLVIGVWTLLFGEHYE